MSSKHRYGYLPDLPDFRDLRLEHVINSASPALPSSIDLRAGMPAVWDQGDLGSCTAHAVGAAVECAQRKQRLEDFDPSRLFIYYNERLIDGDVKTDAGSSLRTGIKSVVKYGVCDSSACKYNVSRFACKPTAKAYTSALKHQAIKYLRVTQDATQIKTTLAGGLPIVFGFTVYESFESDQVAKTGLVPMPSKREKVLGGHAVCIAGYDDTDGTFLVRNSWSDQWGIGGYYKMPYAYTLNSNLADDFWVIQSMEV